MRRLGCIVGLRGLAVIVAAALGGCVVPIPEHAGPLPGQRGNVGDRVPAAIVQGRSTREDVLLTLGEPDRRDQGDRWFAYDSARRVDGVTFLMLVGGGYTSNPGFVLGTQQTVDWIELVLRFDAQGLVVKAELQTQQDRGFSFGGSSPLPAAGRKTLQPSPRVLAHRDAVRTFVPAEPGERLLEGFVAAACQLGGQWHDALAFITDRAVYCWIPAQAGGTARKVLLHWAAGEIDNPEWAPAEAAPDRPAVQLRNRDGTTALFAFYSFEDTEPVFDRARALLFLDSLRSLRDAAKR